MATTPVHLIAETGQTLVITLYPEDSDTATESQAATEQTNRKGLYIASFIATTAGLYYAKVTDGGVHVPPTKVVQMTNTTAIARCGDWLFADLVRLNGNETAAENLALMMDAITTGLVVTDAGNTTLTFKTDLTSAVTDYFGDTLSGGCAVQFCAGSANEGLAKRMVAYNKDTHFVTVESAFPVLPAGSDQFVIVGRIEV